MIHYLAFFVYLAIIVMWIDQITIARQATKRCEMQLNALKNAPQSNKPEKFDRTELQSIIQTELRKMNKNDRIEEKCGNPYNL